MLTNEKIKEIQSESFGKRYEDACMAQISFPPVINKKIQAWLNNPSKMLVLSGQAGCGKTFLCSAILNHFLSKQMNVSPNRQPFIMGYREREFFRLARTQNGEDYSQRLLGLLDYHMIVFDDFGSSGITSWRKEVIYDVINTRYESMLPTVITTNMSYHDIRTNYGDRVADRLFAKDNIEVDMSKLDSKRT